MMPFINEYTFCKVNGACRFQALSGISEACQIPEEATPSLLACTQENPAASMFIHAQRRDAQWGRARCSCKGAEALEVEGLGQASEPYAPPAGPVIGRLLLELGRNCQIEVGRDGASQQKVDWEPLGVWTRAAEAGGRDAPSFVSSQDPQAAQMRLERARSVFNYRARSNATDSNCASNFPSDHRFILGWQIFGSLALNNHLLNAGKYDLNLSPYL